MSKSKVIGTTRSGKVIASTPCNPLHDSFTKQDHADAAAVHLYIFFNGGTKTNLNHHNTHQYGAGDALLKELFGDHRVSSDNMTVLGAELYQAPDAPKAKQDIDWDQWLKKDRETELKTRIRASERFLGQR
jgi:hypothetical protein